MTKTSNNDSILTGRFCEVVNYFLGKEVDDIDRIVQRGLTIIFNTEHLAQTGFEVNPDPFTANMYASAALGSINMSLRSYPFLRVDEVCPSQDREATLASARGLIERAEGLMKLDTVVPKVEGWLLITGDGEARPYTNGNFVDGLLVYGSPEGPHAVMGPTEPEMRGTAFESAAMSMRLADAVLGREPWRSVAPPQLPVDWQFTAADMENPELPKSDRKD